MHYIFLTLLIALFSVSCGTPRYVDYFPYHDDGTIKPRIAFVPIKDSSHSGLVWDLSTELSSEMYSELMNSGELYVLSSEEVGSIWSKCSEIDFFGVDTCFAQQFYNADFIVALELIEHSFQPDPAHALTPCRADASACNHLLTMKMRVRVIDLRFQKSKDILYEIVKTEYHVTAPYDQIDYSKYGWGWDKFDKTPFGQGHQRLISSLAKRLEEAIWSAK